MSCGSFLPVSYLLHFVDHVKVENAVLLANQVKLNAAESWDFVVYFMPRTTVMCRQQLQVEGVYNQIKIGEYPVDLIPFDGDVLSMELNK